MVAALQLFLFTVLMSASTLDDVTRRHPDVVYRRQHDDKQKFSDLYSKIVLSAPTPQHAPSEAGVITQGYRGEARNTLAALAVKILVVFMPVRRISSVVAEVMDHCVQKDENWEPGKGVELFRNLETYAWNLIDWPWKKEFLTISMFSGFYKTRIELNCPVDSALLFALLGYERSADHQLHMRTSAPPPRTQLVAAAFEFFVVGVEFEIQEKILEQVRGEGITAREVYRCRRSVEGTVQSCIESLRKLSKPVYVEMLPNSVLIRDDSKDRPSRKQERSSDRVWKEYNEDKSRVKEEEIFTLNRPSDSERKTRAGVVRTTEPLNSFSLSQSDSARDLSRSSSRNEINLQEDFAIRSTTDEYFQLVPANKKSESYYSTVHGAREREYEYETLSALSCASEANVRQSYPTFRNAAGGIAVGSRGLNVEEDGASDDRGSKDWTGAPREERSRGAHGPEMMHPRTDHKTSPGHIDSVHSQVNDSTDLDSRTINYFSTSGTLAGSKSSGGKDAGKAEYVILHPGSPTKKVFEQSLKSPRSAEVRTMPLMSEGSRTPKQDPNKSHTEPLMRAVPPGDELGAKVWQCGRCTYANEGKSSTCEMCATARSS